jgi:galactokinase
MLLAAERAASHFFRRFGRAPRWIASAPGRVNLIGEHTDYSDGFVLPMAIESRTAVAARERGDRTVRFYSAAFDESSAVDLAGPILPRAKHWSNYAAGVIAVLQQMGVAVPALDIVIESDVPVGAGLSSSAALEVAVATLVECATGLTWDARDKARWCQRAEREFAGVPTGIMDQLVAVLAQPGHALEIDCRSLGVEFVAIDDPDLTVLIVNSNVRHDLADGAYKDRHAATVDAARILGVAALRDATLEEVQGHAAALGPELVARARHVVSENGRVRRAAELCRRRDWNEVGALLYESHASLRDDFDVSCVELDVLVDLAQTIGRAAGVYGCRMTGGGFGGSVVCLGRSDEAARVADVMSRRYADRTGWTATVMTSRPGAGSDVRTLEH